MTSCRISPTTDGAIAKRWWCNRNLSSVMTQRVTPAQEPVVILKCYVRKLLNRHVHVCGIFPKFSTRYIWFELVNISFVFLIQNSVCCCSPEAPHPLTRCIFELWFLLLSFCFSFSNIHESQTQTPILKYHITAYDLWTKPIQNSTVSPTGVSVCTMVNQQHVAHFYIFWSMDQNMDFHHYSNSYVYFRNAANIVEI